MNMLPRGTEKNGGQGSANILLAFCLFLFRKVTASFKMGTLSPETYTHGKEKLGSNVRSDRHIQCTSNVLTVIYGT